MNIKETFLSQLDSEWLSILKDEVEKDYFEDLLLFLENESVSGVSVYPPKELVFNAFRYTPYSQVKVLIMGQDPYHGPGQAHGLCFSVNRGVQPPPSLKNIFKELSNDLGLAQPSHGSLLSWASQGVLLLNATLTVKEHLAKSHYGKGWELFTDAVVKKLAEREDPLIFVLWGKSAQEKCEAILNKEYKQHLVLTATHPSPFSARLGFLGCKHFSKVNAQLSSWDKKNINWELK